MNQTDNRKDLNVLKIDPERKVQKSKIRPWMWVFILGLPILPAVFFFVVSGKPIPEVDILKVKPTPQTDSQSVLTASGYVTPRRKATVASKITGQISKLFVEEGMAVEKGQVLAKLDDSEARARLNASLADLQVARASVTELNVSLDDANRTLKRIQSLFSKKMVSQEELDQTVTARDTIEARLKVAEGQIFSSEALVKVRQEDLDNHIIKSPFEGIAVSKDAQVGEMVSPVSAGGGYTRTGISTIVDMNSLEIEVDVNESYISRVKPGQKVSASLDAYSDWQIPAMVRTVIPTADRQKATVKVRISFIELDPRILPDMGVKVSFLAENGKQGTEKSGIIVPSSALKTEDNITFVYILKKDTVERRAVKTGRSFVGGIEVTAGLKEGETIVLTSSQPLSNGIKVTIKPEG